MRKKVINLRRCILAAIAVCCVLVNMPPRDALAVDLGPTGMITDATPLTTGVTFTDNLVDLVTINTTELQTTIEYTDFNINSGWTVHFQQPGSSANTLNQITGGSPSDIFGTLTSNGGVYIVNPAGVMFHDGSSVNVPRLVASSLWMTQTDFEAGTNFFSGTGGVEAGIGVIEVEDGAIIGDTLKPELVALIGQKVVNSGLIETRPGGLVLMATGDSVFFETSDNVLVELDIDAVTEAKPDVPDWANVVNTETGKITSPSGQIVLAAGDGFAAVLDGIESRPLVVGDGLGTVKQSGILDADGISGGDGGFIAMSAEQQVNIQEGSDATTDGNGEGQGGPISISGESVRSYENLQSGGDMRIQAKNSIRIGENDNPKYLSSGGDLTVISEEQGIYISGLVESEEDMILDAGTFITLLDDAESGLDMDIVSDGGTNSKGNFTALDGDIYLDTNLVLKGGEWVHDEDRDVWAWESGNQYIEAPLGTVTAEGWIEKITPGELHITGGGINEEDKSVDLRYNGDGTAVATWGNIYIQGKGDVQISDDLTAVGASLLWTPKPPHDDFPTESLQTLGGVSVISEEGKIYTASVNRSLGDSLEIGIWGYSDDISHQTDDYREPMGVDLPYTGEDGEVLGKAAIVLQSHDTLKLGENSSLNASGIYLAADPDVQNNGDFVGVDDRPGINFLDEDAVIGGYARDQGIPSDVAIYAASTTGDVEVDTQNVWVNSGTTINTSVRDNGYYGNPTVVFDAYNTVRFTNLEGVDSFTDLWLLFTSYESVEEFLYYAGYKGDLAGFLDYHGYDSFDGFARQDLEWLLGEYPDFRVEVCSRITEWLSEAIAWDTLPFANNPELMEVLFGDEYILRGAGDFPHPDPEAPDLWTERAWVLEDPPPSFVEAAPLPILELPELKGCPVELEAAAAEVGLGPEELQLLVGNSLAANPNIQPCDACARLVEAAKILQDVDGAYMAAMNNVFNSIAPANMPFSPETETLIVTAFSGMSDEQPQYAAAMEYIDAFVDYIAVLDTDLGSPVEDSAAYVLAKYGSPVTGNPNGNMSAYVMSQIEGIGG